MLEIKIRPLARKDIKSIWHYTYKNWGIRQADYYSEHMGEAIKSLTSNPKIGISIDQIRDGYRMYHHEHHLIVYQEFADSVEVVRVLGENMDPERYL